MDDYEMIDKIKNYAATHDNSIDDILSNYILDNFQEIPETSLIVIAKACNISKPTIVRYCKKINLSGFNELKFRVKNVLKNRPNYLDPFYEKSDLYIRHESWLKQYNEVKKQSSDYVLNDFLQGAERISRLIKKIGQSNNIYIFAMNAAYNTSKNLYQRIRSFNRNVVIESDLNSINSYINFIESNDVVIVVSLSGTSVFIRDLVKKIKGKCFIYGIMGSYAEIATLCDDYFILPNIEQNLWDIFSIRAQSLMQFWDYVYYLLSLRQVHQIEI